MRDERAGVDGPWLMIGAVPDLRLGPPDVATALGPPFRDRAIQKRALVQDRTAGGLES